ncbi:uncharacterized protein LOC110625576 [Manihot esculenta]|uniref:uncharacterized protein LOC110625576 n=1 Tax=Manihot esculenta TaxID=3983 RepID=UPI000B5D86C0|nr:uncharacterized protein LOC110625576 [Manihot esculenta]
MASQAELDDALSLSNSNNPNLKLVSFLLTGPNYLSWTRSMLLALRAKEKMGFVTGKIAKSPVDSPMHEKWLTVDSMVISWILNAISREIAEEFLFGEGHGPLFFQIKKELVNISQSTSTLAAYYTKLKKCWDEISVLCSLPSCNCGAAKALSKFEEREKLIQFFMGLNHHYDHVINQILIMEPLPSSTKAYAMVLNIERQNEIQIAFSQFTETTMALAVQRPSRSRRFTNIDNSRYNNKPKSDRFCDYCQTSGHLREKCLKLHGYPE